MLAEEKYGRRNLHPFDLLGYDRKACSSNTGEEDNDSNVSAQK